jgi:hypothetical protein
MKFFITFILCFLLMSALPILWNQFSFVEAGFPFPYLFKKSIETAEMSALSISSRPLYLLYDLLIAAILAWAIRFLILTREQTKLT